MFERGCFTEAEKKQHILAVAEASVDLSSVTQGRKFKQVRYTGISYTYAT